MKVEKFCRPEHGQMAQIGKHNWFVARLIQLSKDLEVFEIPLRHMNTYFKYDNMTLRDMVMHMQAVNDADLSYPIILDEDGEVMDGRHRIMKAILEGKESLNAVRFEKNPSPCQVDD